MNRRKLLVAIVAAAAMIVPGLTATLAQASTHHRVLIGGDARRRLIDGLQICSEQMTSECWHVDGMAGDNVTGVASGNHFVTNYDNVCNGGHTVTDNCPFASGSGLNTEFEGSDIITIQRELCCIFVNGSASNNIYQSDGTGNGLEWVQVGSMSSTGPGAELINVYNSNQNSRESSACANGASAPLDFEAEPSSSAAECFWFGFAG